MQLCHPTGSKAWRRKVWGIFSFAGRWSQASHAVSFPHQTVNYADVPLVLFQPQMHVLTHAVETAQVGGASQLPVTLRNLHTQCKRWSNKGTTSLIIRRAINKAYAHTQYIPCCGIEKACTIVWRGCRRRSGQRGANPGTAARPLCCSWWPTPPPPLGRTWLHRRYQSASLPLWRNWEGLMGGEDTYLLFGKLCRKYPDPLWHSYKNTGR